jgi:hypothetical protein
MKDIMNIKWRASAENMRKLSSCNGSSSAGSWRSQDSGSYMSKVSQFLHCASISAGMLYYIHPVSLDIVVHYDGEFDNEKNVSHA